MSEHCVVCGHMIPEGRQVCPICEARTVSRGLVALTFREAERQHGSIRAWCEHDKDLCENTVYALSSGRSPKLTTFVRLLSTLGLELRIRRKTKNDSAV